MRVQLKLIVFVDENNKVPYLYHPLVPQCVTDSIRSATQLQKTAITAPNDKQYVCL